jgi:crossover junction endodeoxyribonuclease RuvC
MRVVGLDPGLRHMGWGIIEAEGHSLRHIANGVIKSTQSKDLAQRLVELHDGLQQILIDFEPQEAAVEITLANKNPSSTLKLGMARGIALVTPALAGLPVGEYLPMIVKKAVVGNGHATKDQVGMMVGRLLPGCEIASADAADALAVAICHAHNVATRRKWSGGGRDPLVAGDAAVTAGRVSDVIGRAR